MTVFVASYLPCRPPKLSLVQPLPLASSKELLDRSSLRIVGLLAMPVAHTGFAHLPAQHDLAKLRAIRQVEQTLFQIVQMDAYLFNLGHQTLGLIGSRSLFGSLPRHLANIHMHAAADKNMLPQVVHLRPQPIGRVCCLLRPQRQGFKQWQKRLHLTHRKQFSHRTHLAQPYLPIRRERSHHVFFSLSDRSYRDLGKSLFVRLPPRPYHWVSMSFQDSAVIFFIALLLFGPKKLPELARQVGKLMGEFRRASSDFRMQMEDELRVSEQAERQKQIAALESASPAPELPVATNTTADTGISLTASDDVSANPLNLSETSSTTTMPVAEHSIAQADLPAPPDRYRHEVAEADPAPVPIATAGELTMMPPASGLPVGRTNSGVAQAFESIPQAPASPQPDSETAHHG